MESRQAQYMNTEYQYAQYYVIVRTNNVKGFENSHAPRTRRVNGGYCWVSEIYPRPRRTNPQETPVCGLDTRISTRSVFQAD
jgi:hypothetical protein